MGKLQLDGVFDIDFDEYVTPPPIQAALFGEVCVRVDWDHWESLFFEVFNGNLMKKVGTSGNIVASQTSCSLEHNACIPQCQGHQGADCIFEFDDHFAHSRDERGEVFSQDDLAYAGDENAGELLCSRRQW